MNESARRLTRYSLSWLRAARSVHRATRYTASSPWRDPRGPAVTLTIDAVYANGRFQPKQPVPLAEGAHVQLTVHTAGTAEDPFEAVIGTCDGPPDGAANHDRYLYGDR